MIARIVVCAANRHKDTGLLITGARHFDSVMMAQIEAMGMSHHDFHEQGFIDQFGVFMGRREAMRVALASGQRLRNREAGQYDGPDLFSEDLY